MPAPEASADSRRRTLLMALFWVGVGLAPLAALLLLLAQGSGSLRMAAVLSVLAVVLIGLSITLRGDSETVRLHLEETLLDEVEALREDLRHDIATAARATHRAFGEKLQVVQDNVEALRAQVATGRVEPPRPGYDGYDHTDPPMPVAAQHPGPVRPPAAGQYGAPAGAQGAAGHQQPARSPSGGRASVPVAAIPMPRPPVSGALVRHTETVQVTTRHTVVDPHHDPHHEEPNAGNVYGGGGYDGGGYGGHEAEPVAERSRPPQRGRRAEADEDPWGDQLRPQPRGGDRRPYDEGPADDDWSGVRAGDRWASVRSDEHGRELRMGERRASMYADESGAELRVEDRWAAVRHEDPRRDGPWRDGSHDARWDEEPRWRDADRGAREETGWDRRGGPAALPAGGTAMPASWTQVGAEPEREPVRRGRRHRDDEGYGYPPVDDAPRAGRGRRMEYEYSDDGWR
ncbi:hypothetical protein SAMN05444365_101729 [Micromonospora pattaloongensis]|uniref:Uncharacterized protein n=1 Tax=Micromonospora pattaloongensis TaxID=405436 RepID=A0A1H3H8D7_9ACTN|nr:hypothetical protein [Micromonospora pattaloongensis]SDY11843.1 hypothetical protein SAMN05444365_101729 [Micromonospora pattaloongensis]